MINIIKKAIATIIITASVCGVFFTVLSPQTVSAASSKCSESFLGFPAWYRGLVDSSNDCTIISPGSSNELSNFIWHIVLNVIEIGMRLVAYISIAFILYGGFQYIISRGNSDGIVKAKTTLFNAVIGLVISIIAVAAVNFIIMGLLGN